MTLKVVKRRFQPSSRSKLNVVETNAQMMGDCMQKQKDQNISPSFSEDEVYSDNYLFYMALGILHSVVQKIETE
jgi:hypothetical protein